MVTTGTDPNWLPGEFDPALRKRMNEEMAAAAHAAEKARTAYGVAVASCSSARRMASSQRRLPNRPERSRPWIASERIMAARRSSVHSPPTLKTTSRSAP